MELGSSPKKIVKFPGKIAVSYSYHFLEISQSSETKVRFDFSFSVS
jgi:hypothetical protein